LRSEPLSINEEWLNELGFKNIFSDDVKRITFKNIKGNKYLYLSVKNTILNQNMNMGTSLMGRE
jgi:hypothetical protein